MIESARSIFADSFRQGVPLANVVFLPGHERHVAVQDLILLDVEANRVVVMIELRRL